MINPISMRRILICLMICFATANTGYTQAQNEPEIISGGFTVEFPMFETASKIQLFRDTIHFFEQGNMILYAFPFTYESFKSNISQDQRKSYHYLMVEKFSEQGLYFPSLQDSTERQWVLKDSLLAAKNLSDKRFQNLLVYDSLIKRTFTPDSMLLEKYIPIHAFKGKIFDTTECYFSAGLRDFPLSLSTSMDSVHSRKLRKIRTVYNSRYFADLKSNIPKQVWTYELIQENLSEGMYQEISNFFLLAKQYFLEK